MKKKTKDTNEEEFEFLEDDEDVEFESLGEEDALGKIQKLKEKLKACEKERQEYLLGWQRERAEFANSKKQSDLSQKEYAKFASADILHQILPVLDSFTMAFANKEAWEKVDSNWRTGVEYIYSQLRSVLKDNGLEEHDPMGEIFDPTHHESVGTVETKKKKDDHVVLEVVSKGYRLHGKMVRPARVKVGKYLS